MNKVIIDWSEIYLDTTWLVLVPASAEWLQEWVDANEEGGVDIYGKVWMGVFKGKGEYSALVKIDNKSAEGSSYFIKELSSLFPGKKLYEFIIEDDGIFDPATVYVNGEPVEKLKQDIYDLAESILGVPLPNPPEKHKPVTTAVCVIEDVVEGEVKRVIEKQFPNYPPFDLIKSGRNIILHNKNVTVSSLGAYFSSDLNKSVYSLFCDSSPSKGSIFLCSHFLGEQCKGEYSYPRGNVVVGWDDDFPTVDNIMGETEPKKIAQKLGVPLDLLGLE